MYNNIGLTSVRGTGTSGHIKKNKASLTGFRQNLSWEASLEREEKLQQRKPVQLVADQGILDHEKKKKIEIAVLEWADATGLLDSGYVLVCAFFSNFTPIKHWLYTSRQFGTAFWQDGLQSFSFCFQYSNPLLPPLFLSLLPRKPQEEIDRLMANKREQITEQQGRYGPPTHANAGSLPRSGHQDRYEKEQHQAKMASALGIRDDYREGQAFDKEYQLKEREARAQKREEIELLRREEARLMQQLEEKRKEYGVQGPSEGVQGDRQRGEYNRRYEERGASRGYDRSHDSGSRYDRRDDYSREGRGEHRRERDDDYRRNRDDDDHRRGHEADREPDYRKSRMQDSREESQAPSPPRNRREPSPDGRTSPLPTRTLNRGNESPTYAPPRSPVADADESSSSHRAIDRKTKHESESKKDKPTAVHQQPDSKSQSNSVESTTSSTTSKDSSKKAATSKADTKESAPAAAAASTAAPVTAAPAESEPSSKMDVDQAPESEQDEEEHDESPKKGKAKGKKATAAKKTKAKSSASAKKAAAQAESATEATEEEEGKHEESEDTPKKTAKRGRAKKATAAVESTDSLEHSEDKQEAEAPAPKRAKRGRAKSTASAENDSDEEFEAPPAKRSKQS